MFEHLDYKAYPILYVDDEPFALDTVQRQFKHDFTILIAPSGAKGLEVLAEQAVAVVLSDQRMPDMSGTQFLARVRAEHPETVRMLLTAYSDIESVVDAINLGNVCRYLTKPYEEREVRMALREGIERYVLVKERDTLYAEKIETMKRIARANRLSAVGTLAAGLAHEINNPLVPISTFLQMLPAKRKEPQPDEEYWGALYQVTVKEVERIRGLIRQLLTYAKFTGEAELNLEPVDFNALAHHMVVFLDPQARSKGVTVALTPAPTLTPVWVDAERIKQVFLNLLLNAIQAMPTGGTVTVTVRATTVKGCPHAEVEVADTGTGIPPDHLEKLFTPFFTTKGHEGSGLGLLTCHQVIDEHRGLIHVQSEVGRGTTFTVKLPINPRTYDRRRNARRWDDDSSLPAVA
ncbi:MAG: response regulator [Nitrospirae bacterium]|nr:response regulator [Nitrospirota bacterium]